MWTYQKNWRFEKTDFGWNAYKKHCDAFIYFGHFQTQKDAKAAAAAESNTTDLTYAEATRGY
jgi:hypothetical protein